MNEYEFVDEKYRLQYSELFEYVDIVVGTITSLGRHAAGLVVAPYPVDDVFGTLYISSDEKPISQINMKEIDSLNFVKLDVLGLDCVGLIYKTCEAVGIPFLTPDNLDFNDEEVWEDIAKDTTLIFQFESDFAGSYLRDILRPQVIKKIKEKNSNLSISFYLLIIPYNSIRNTKILQTIPPQNRYNFKPSYLKKLFLLSSSSRIFCFITLVSVSDCFSRSFVALCIASIFACNAFLTSWTVFSLTSSFKLPISPDIAS